MGGPADTAGTRAGGLADTVADSVGDRVAVVGSVTAVVGMAGRPEVSAGSEIPMAARAGALGVPVPCRGQAARRGDSIPANRRATALAELSPAKLCLIEPSAFAADVVVRQMRAPGLGDEGDLALRFGKPSRAVEPRARVLDGSKEHPHHWLSGKCFRRPRRSGLVFR